MRIHILIFKSHILKLRLFFYIGFALLFSFHGNAQKKNTFSKKELWGLAPTPGYIYKLDQNGGNKEIVYKISGANGYGPGSGGSLLQASNKKLYGMTSNAGENNMGTLFEYDPVQQKFTTLVVFDGTNGKKPKKNNVIQATNGKLYGMTPAGGDYNQGIIFEYDLLTNTFKKIFNFHDSIGKYPHGDLYQIKDTNKIILYGMTSEGGKSNGGVLFAFNLTDNSYGLLKNFDGYYPYHKELGRHPEGSVIQANNGKIYGLTPAGGAYNYGVLFEYDPHTGTFKKLFDFKDYDTGTNPSGSLIQATDGKLYGTTNYGGANYAGGGGHAGTVFSYDLATGTFSKRADLGAGAGTYPLGTLLQASNGKMYGTSYLGACSSGGVFCYDPVTDTIYRTACNGYPNGNLIEIDAPCKVTRDSIAAEACVSYVSPSGRHVWTESGIYTDTLSNAGGCDSILTINLKINKVDITVTQSGVSLMAHADSAGFQWLDCGNGYATLPGDTNKAFTATRNGHYAVLVRQGICADTSACYFINTVGIDNKDKTNEAFVASGSEANGNNGAASYTIGQLFYTTHTGSSGKTFSQGIQQPYEISVYTAVPHTDDIMLDMIAYPNPVKGNLRLRTGKHYKDNIYYELVDMKGNVLKSEKITSPEMVIPMQQIIRSTYFLIIIQKTPQQKIKVFKIIKK
jgi:uncharacterized repeat protein (TIGR03803 family)